MLSSLISQRLSQLLGAEFVLAMPGEVLWIGPKRRIGWKVNARTMVFAQGLLLARIFVKCRVRDDHVVVFIERPESLVKHPMRVLA